MFAVVGIDVVFDHLYDRGRGSRAWPAPTGALWARPIVGAGHAGERITIHWSERMFTGVGIDAVFDHCMIAGVGIDVVFDHLYDRGRGSRAWPAPTGVCRRIAVYGCGHGQL